MSSYERRIHQFEWAVKEWQRVEGELECSRADVEAAAKALRGDLPVREIARLSGLSPATISNLFRGRLVVSSPNAIALAKILHTL